MAKTGKKRKPALKGMQNKRYRKTEDAILDVLLRSKTMPSTGEITRQAKISRSTLYRHHRAMPGIIPDYEREILAIFKRETKKMPGRRSDLEGSYLKILIFVLKHKRVFKILFRYSGDRVIEIMVLELKLQIMRTCHLAKNSERMIKIYAKEVAGIVEDWAEKGFQENKITLVMKDIMHLTTTLRQRLGPLMD